MKTLSPDFLRRTGIRMLFDGRYKFARYFSLRQHNTPHSFAELLALNDLELYDLEEDPQEINNLARDAEKSRALIMAMNHQLNALYQQEIGQDDGSFLPPMGQQDGTLILRSLPESLKTEIVAIKKAPRCGAFYH